MKVNPLRIEKYQNNIYKLLFKVNKPNINALEQENKF